jgi:cobalt/nickel transport system permease protein
LHHRTVEQLAAADSPVHRLDPRAKLVACLAFVICASVLPPWPLWRYVPLLVLVLVALAMARLPWGFVMARTLLVLPFVGLVALFLPFTRGTDVLWTWQALGLSVYREGIELALSILIKGGLAILGVSWLVFTTPFHRLLLAFRALGAPRVIAAVLGFLFRYLDLLADEGLRVRRARLARSPGRIRRWRGRSTEGLVGRLLLRTLDRAERVHRAMVARGYDGEVRILSRLHWRTSDLGFLLLCALLLGPAAASGFLLETW